MKKIATSSLLGISFIFCCHLASYCQLKDGGQLIQLNERNVQVFTKGVINRSSDQPVIILESGLGSPIENWNSLLKRMPDSLPIFAYERAGIGKSDMTDFEPDPEFTANRLKEILSILRIEPPYVLVGHSWGGVLINSYAVNYPEEVVGMVYIDESDIINNRENSLEAIKRASNGKVSTDVIREKANELFQQAPPGIAEEWKVIYKLTEQGQTDSLRFTPPEEFPTAILVAGKYSPPPMDLGNIGFELSDYHEELLKIRVEKFEERIINNPYGIFLLANNLGHYMHVENPSIVASIIEEIYLLSK